MEARQNVEYVVNAVSHAEEGQEREDAMIQSKTMADTLAPDLLSFLKPETWKNARLKYTVHTVRNFRCETRHVLIAYMIGYGLHYIWHTRFSNSNSLYLNFQNTGWLENNHRRKLFRASLGVLSSQTQFCLTMRNGYVSSKLIQVM